MIRQHAASVSRRTRLLGAGAAVVILLLAAGLRLHRLEAQSFWNDEGNSVVQAGRSFADIAANAARDIHPPGYYWALALWRLGAGESEFALRALSSLAGVVTAALVIAVGWRLFNPGVGLLAGLLTALNTFSIYYGQEARMYALLALWAAASTWALLACLTTPRRRYWLALALFSAAGLWTHFSYPFVMLAQAAVFLVGWWQRRSRATLMAYVLANGLTIALFLPWLSTALNQITGWPNTGQAAPFAEALGVILNWLTFGLTYERGSAGALGVANLLLVFGLLPVSGQSPWRRFLPAALTAIPVALFLVFGLYREANLKFLLPAQIGAALWLARGVWVVWQGAESRTGQASRIVFRLAAVAGTAYLLLNLAAVLGPLYDDPAYQRDDYRTIAAEIEARLRSGDAIILDAPNQEEVFRYYFRPPTPIYPLPPGLGGDDQATRAAVETIIDRHERVFVVFWGEAERDPNRVVETTLDAGAYEIGDRWYGDVRLAQYIMAGDLAVSGRQAARFGDEITLRAWALSAATAAPGDTLLLRLDWQTDAPLTTRYKVFVQLLDPGGLLAAQRDSEPGGGLALTTTWTPGSVVIDRHALALPADLAPGEYTLIAGLYPLDNPAARLPVEDSTFHILTKITVE